MIRFNREIRQNLLVEGKTIPYSIYTVGAIIFDVIGIFTILPPANHFKSLEP